MERPHDIAQQINDLLIRAADSISEFNPDFDPQIRTADERFGDFQANGILPFAKKNNLNPRELGEKLIASLPPSEDWEISLAGPGFINFKLSKEFSTTVFISPQAALGRPCETQAIHSTMAL